MTAEFLLWFSKSELVLCNSRLLVKRVNRKANREFATTASKFMKEVQQQMGVKLFILAGYRDIDGKIARVK